MKINTETLVTVLLALALFKLLDKLFLDKMLSGIAGSFEEMFEEN